MPSKRINKRVNKLFEDITIAKEEGKTPSSSVLPPEAIKPPIAKTKEPAREKKKTASKPKPAPAPVAQTSPAPAPVSVIQAEGEAYSTPPVVLPDWNSLQVIDEEKQRTWNPNEKILVDQVIDQLSLALQNANLFQQTQKQTVELAVLNDMARQLSAQLSIDGVSQTVYEFTSKLMDTKHFFVALYYPEVDQMYLPIIYIKGKREDGVRIDVGNGLTGYVLRNRQPVLLQDNIIERTKGLGLEILQLSDDDDHTECWLGVPMILGEKILGALVVQSDITPRLYDDHHQELLTSIAGQAAIAFQNADLFQQTERQNKELAVLNEMGRALSAQLDKDQIADTIYRFTGRLTNVQNFFVAYFDETSKGIDLRYFIIDGEKITVPGRQLGKGLTDYVLRNRKSMLFNGDVTAQATALGIETIIVGNNKGALSWLGVPLMVADRTLGAIVLQSTETENLFTERDRDILSTIANQSAIAIQNANLFELEQERGRVADLLRDISYAFVNATAASTTNEIGNTIKKLGEFAKADRAYYFEYGNDLTTVSCTQEWCAKDVPAQIQDLKNIPVDPASWWTEKITGGETISISRVADLPEKASALKEFLSSQGVQSMIAVPVSTGQSAHGYIGLDTRTSEHLWTEQEIRLVQLISQTLSTAIVRQQAQLSEESSRKALQQSEEALRRQNEYLATAADVGRLITSTLELDSLFARTVDLIHGSFGYYYAGIFIIDDSGFNAVLREGTGKAGTEMKGRQHSIAVGSRSIIGQVTSVAKTIIVNNTAIDPLHRQNPALPETRAEAAIPLKVGDRIIGAIDIQANAIGAFTPEDVAVLEILSDQIAVAIENARSYDVAQKAVEEMRETDRIKSQFLANMSHELRTPLNSIIGFSRVILKGIDGPINEQQQQDLSAIYNSGQHLLGLINDILDLSKIEAGKMELSFDEVNISDTIHSVMSTAMGLVKDKPIKLKQDTDKNLPTVRADSMRLRQILINLLSNAAKFTDEGNIVVNASVHTSSLGIEEVIVSVTDSGPGISAEDQTKLFKAFSQVDSSATRKSGGTGLGLSISQRLVELQGGRIGVHSAAGKGSTFYFTIPVFNQKQEENIPANSKVILCIDDDEQIISLYKRYLEPQGYYVYALTNPELAKETAIRIKPYAITLDIMMPGRDGWSVINELKADSATRELPVIICSIVEESERGFSLGAADYLVKPILEDDILGALNRLNGDGSIQEVLIIDDDANDLRLIEKIISERSQYVPKLIQGGQKGWEELLNNPPQAIILDLFMPDVDGFTILERMRANPSLRDIPVIVVSGIDLNKDQQKQLEGLGQRLLQKSLLTEQELFVTLERALKRLEQKK